MSQSVFYWLLSHAIHVPHIELGTETWRLDCVFSPDDLNFDLDTEHGLCPCM